MLFFTGLVTILNIIILLGIVFLIVWIMLKLLKQKIAPVKIIKFVAIYEAVALIFFLIYQKLEMYLVRIANAQTLGDRTNAILFYTVIFSGALFAIFFYANKITLALNVKKALAIFLLVAIVMYFFMPFNRYILMPLYSIPVLQKELSEINVFSFIYGYNQRPIINFLNEIIDSIGNPGRYLFVRAVTL